MIKMLFKPEYVIPILLGRKRVTRRAKRPREGVDRVYKCQRMLFTPDYFAEIIFTDKFQQPLDEMTAKDYKAEGFKDREAFISAWEGITKEEINEKAEVWVLPFDLVRVGPNYVGLLELIKDIDFGSTPLTDLDQILLDRPKIAKFFPSKKKDLPTEQVKAKPDRALTIDEIVAGQAEHQAMLQELADQKVEITKESIEVEKKWNALEHQRRRLLVNERIGRRRRRVRGSYR